MADDQPASQPAGRLAGWQASWPGAIKGLAVGRRPEVPFAILSPSRGFSLEPLQHLAKRGSYSIWPDLKASELMDGRAAAASAAEGSEG